MPKDNSAGMRLPSLDDIFTSQKERDEADLKKIYEIPLSDIDPFPDHPFKFSCQFEFGFCVTAGCPEV